MSFQAFFDGYIECAAWSSADPETDKPLDDVGADFSTEALAALRVEAQDFYDANEESWQDVMSDEQAGHDFWLTRNGHGAGFWDRGFGELGEDLSAAAKVYGTCDLYLTDNNEIGVM